MDPTTEVPLHTGLLSIMGPEGDVAVYWDMADPATVAAAEAKFNALVGGPSVELRPGAYAAFRLDPGGATGEQIRAFDRDAAQIILVPPLVGG